MRELFIYYRIRHADVGRARQAAEAMQARLRSVHPGLRARLLQCEDESGGAQTWMETYATAAGTSGVDAMLEASIEAGAAAWADLVDGLRHVEAFRSVFGE
ncbi:MAG: DUF4936 family protein [Caldimonas sp.]